MVVLVLFTVLSLRSIRKGYGRAKTWPFTEMHVNLLIEENLGFINENMETWLAFQVACTGNGVPFQLLK